MGEGRKEFGELVGARVEGMGERVGARVEGTEGRAGARVEGMGGGRERGREGGLGEGRAAREGRRGWEVEGGRLTTPCDPRDCSLRLFCGIAVNPEVPRSTGEGVAGLAAGVALLKSLLETLGLLGEGVTFPISSLTLKCCEEIPQSTLYHQSHTSLRWLKMVVLGHRKLFILPSA